MTCILLYALEAGKNAAFVITHCLFILSDYSINNQPILPFHSLKQNNNFKLFKYIIVVIPHLFGRARICLSNGKALW